MTDRTPSLLEFLATLALFIGPILTYLIARRKESKDSLLADLEAIRGWAEERRAFEQDLRDARALIKQLYAELDTEAEKRRAADDRAEELLARVEKLEELLIDCKGLTLG